MLPIKLIPQSRSSKFPTLRTAFLAYRATPFIRYLAAWA